MSSIVGMTSVIYGADRADRISYINTIISQFKEIHSSLLVERIESDKNSIGIAEIRSLIDKSSYTSLTASHRFFVIHDAHKLTDQAQNALLKLYEEPPADSTYILELDSYQSLLPTIISRAVLNDISESGEGRPLEKFAEQHSFPESRIMKEASLVDLFKYCEEYAKEREVAKEFVSYFMVLVCDGLRIVSLDKRKQGVAYMEFLLQAHEWLAETNVNPRLLLENCILGWWKWNK